MHLEQLHYVAGVYLFKQIAQCDSGNSQDLEDIIILRFHAWWDRFYLKSVCHYPWPSGIPTYLWSFIAFLLYREASRFNRLEYWLVCMDAMDSNNNASLLHFRSSRWAFSERHVTIFSFSLDLYPYATQVFHQIQNCWHLIRIQCDM